MLTWKKNDSLWQDSTWLKPAKGGHASTSRVIAFSAEACRFKQLLSTENHQNFIKRTSFGENSQSFNLSSTVRAVAREQMRAWRKCNHSTAPHSSVECRTLDYTPITELRTPLNAILLAGRQVELHRGAPYPLLVNLDASCQGPASKTPPSGERGSERHSS